MDTNDFRKHAHDLVDWMADYLEGVERYPVRAQSAPGDILDQLPATPPEDGEKLETIFQDFQDVLLPGITHWQHPGFFGYFPANSSPPSVLAEMLTATLAVQGMSWQTSPAATELETRVMEWLRLMLGLPEGFTGVIHDTASVATLSALLVARERATAWRGNDEGLNVAGNFCVYASEETHSSIDKAVRIAGLGQRNLRKIPVRDDFSMDPQALEAAVLQDLEAGHVPVCVVATLGTTGASGFDPLRPIGALCAKHKIWLHVDAAWAGSAMIVPEERWMSDGMELADSFVFNPHKWLLTNFDCTSFFVREPEALLRTFEILPEYLKTREGTQVINYRDWGIQLGRRFRALKLWFVIRSYGVDGLRSVVRNHAAWARALAREIDATPDFELLAPAQLALFCFRYKPEGIDTAALDDLNARLLEAVNDSGQIFVTHTRIRGAYAIRFSIGQTRCTEAHVKGAWDLIRETARTQR